MNNLEKLQEKFQELKRNGLIDVKFDWNETAVKGLLLQYGEIEALDILAGEFLDIFQAIENKEYSDLPELGDSRR